MPPLGSPMGRLTKSSLHPGAPVISAFDLLMVFST